MEKLLTKIAAVTNKNDGWCGTDTFFNWGCENTDNPIIDVIITIFNWLSIGVVTVVIIFVVVGAIQYMSAGGNSDNSKKAKDRIRNAIIALGLYLIMWALLNFLVPGGMLGGS